jgi:hypothetical protein
MSALIGSARTLTEQVDAVLDRVAEEGDLAAAIGDALAAGHVLYLIADEPAAWLAGEIAAALRRRFPDPAWPPVFAVAPDAHLLALLGRDYGIEDPLRLQCEILLRPGDLALLLPCGEPDPDFLDLARLAAAQGATVAALGPALDGLDAHPRLSLPEGDPDTTAAAQLALGLALAAVLADRLPAEPPEALLPAVEPFLCRNCAHPLLVPAHLAGRLGTCPYCHNNTVLGTSAAYADGDPRRRMRFTLRDCRLRLALAPPEGPSTPLAAQTTLENLSRGGLLCALVDCPVEITPDVPVRIELHTPAFEEPLVILGTVARVTREGPIQHVGMVFVSLEPTVAERLHILEQNLVLRNVVHPPAE